MILEESLKRAADYIAESDAIYICAGAGMGVDSGLPDFRGKEGFWKAYPAIKRLNLDFQSMANPKLFFSDPRIAWGFYGHRYNLYQETTPHSGFSILKRWCDKKKLGGFVFTSNVDGHFQKAGFDDSKVVECHGRTNTWQCRLNCSNQVWKADVDRFDVDFGSLKVHSELPLCPNCGEIARPNILMFNDWQWASEESNHQEVLARNWLNEARHHQLAVIEIGAGSAVATVRNESGLSHGKLIRINLRDYDVPEDAIGVGMGAKSALEKIDSLI